MTAGLAADPHLGNLGKGQMFAKDYLKYCEAWEDGITPPDLDMVTTHPH